MTDPRSVIRSYRPGGWYAVFGEHVSVLLPASEKSRVADLWERVDAGADFDELLDALISTGLRSLPGFVLVSTAEEPTRIVLRGAARAVVHLEDGQVVDVDGGAAATWVERAVSEVASLQLVLEESGNETDHGILEGLVRVSRVDQPALVEQTTTALPEDDHADEDDVDPTPNDGQDGLEHADAVDGEADPGATVLDLPPVVEQAGPSDDHPVSAAAGEPSGPPGNARVGAPDGRFDSEPDSWGSDPLAPAAPAAPAEVEVQVEEAPTPGVQPESGLAAGSTVEPGRDLPVEPEWGQSSAHPFAPGAETPDPPVWEPPETGSTPPLGGTDPVPAWGAAPLAPAPSWGADAEDHDHDGHTVAGPVGTDQFARQHPGIPGQPQAPSVTAQPVARLVFSNGEAVDVDRAVLIGRAPEARRFTSTEQPRLVTVPSPNQEISSTHLEVRPGSGADHGSAIVTDMGSTNGTVLTQPGFSPEDLQPGIAVQLLPGAIIDLGDGVTIQVMNTAGHQPSP